MTAQAFPLLRHTNHNSGDNMNNKYNLVFVSDATLKKRDKVSHPAHNFEFLLKHPFAITKKLEVLVCIFEEPLPWF